MKLNVSNELKSRLTRAPGVGKKLAERILLELRDKVKNEELSQQLQQVSQVSDQLASGSGNIAEAVSALVVLDTARARLPAQLRASRQRPAFRT